MARIEVCKTLHMSFLRKAYNSTMLFNELTKAKDYSCDW